MRRARKILEVINIRSSSTNVFYTFGLIFFFVVNDYSKNNFIIMETAMIIE